MHPIHDIDVLLLLALSLASKRRPAELVEIMAAADLTQATTPPEAKWVEAFARLASHGLLSEVEGRYTLTPEAEIVMAGQPRQTDVAKRTFRIKEKLAAYTVSGEHAPVIVTAAQITAAILEQRKSGKDIAVNLLVPKPKPPQNARPGLRRTTGGKLGGRKR